MFVCTANGIVVFEHTNKAAIQVKSFRKAELIAELAKRGLQVYGNVNELRGILKAEIEKLKEKYSSEQKRVDIIHLDKDIGSFDSVCSASSEILLMASNAKRSVYQILIQRDGVGFVGSVTRLVSYPDSAAKVTSMTASNGNLYFSSEGPQGGLFQVNLESRYVSCLVSASPNCEVHGIASFKQGIAFTDPKTHKVKQYTPSAGVTILAGNGKEGTGKGSAKSASFM